MAKAKQIELVSLAGVCQMFGDKNPATIWAWVNRGLIPEPVHYGNRSMWKKDELEKSADKVTFFKPRLTNERKLNDKGQEVKGLGKVNKVTITNLPTVFLYPEGK